jgi:hypothetical protein
MVVLALIVKTACGQENQHGAQAFSATIDNIFRDLPHQCHFGMEPGPDNPVNGLHVIGQEGL